VMTRQTRARRPDGKGDILEAFDLLRNQRLEKLKKLEEMGVTAFPYRYDRTHQASEAVALFQSTKAGTRAFPSREESWPSAAWEKPVSVMCATNRGAFSSTSTRKK